MDNKKQILVNTSMLYIRMLIILFVTLYTSRIVLDRLGVVDFGIYNVVGGVVMLFSFLNSSMSSATQRFMSFELGKHNSEKLCSIFCMTINIHVLIALIVLILAETLGLWFINTKLVIPDERVFAANWVYQFSILTFILTILGVPYNAIIIAYEKMRVYAMFSILDVILKLALVFSLIIFDSDKLILYSFLIFIIALITFLAIRAYCIKNFSVTRYMFHWDSSLFKVLSGYAGWNLFGNIAVVGMNQGINILLNIFFGPKINAARAIAFQINGAVNSFATNFQLAINPQIVKSFASDRKDYMKVLIFQGAKYSFFLLFILCLPLIIETDFILNLWLKHVPAYANLFSKLILINILIDSFSGTLITAVQATGRIRFYQMVVGSLLILIIPISYLFLRLGFKPEISFIVSIAISSLALILRLIIINKLVGIPIFDFIYNVIVKALIVVISSSILPLSIKASLDQNTINSIYIVIISILSTLTAIYLVGISSNERFIIKSKLLKLFYQ